MICYYLCIHLFRPQYDNDCAAAAAGVNVLVDGRCDAYARQSGQKWVRGSIA